jgi:hypothetical protein
MIPAGARCGLHADVAAVDVCKRCGRFLCGECVQLSGEDAYCAECAARLKAGPASGLSKAAFGLAAASWVMLAVGMASHSVVVTASGPLSIIGVFVSVVELIRISRGDASPRGRGRALIGLVSGLVLVLLFAMSLAALYLWRKPAP